MTTITKKIAEDIAKRIMEENDSARNAGHYLAIQNIIKQLQKSISEHSTIVNDNKKLLNEYYKLMGIADKNEIRYEQQIKEMQNQIERISNIDHLQGEPGKDGENGKDAFVDEEKIVSAVLSQIKVENGKDAIIDEDALIEKLVQYIKDKKPIDISHIRNWQSLKSKKSDMNDMRWHGGGATLVAGSNVTLTVNANGTTTVASSGGGAFTLLTATGTIDDSNTAFIFVSEPTTLVINGGMYQKTGGAITWTWNAGTLTATLSVPVGTNGTIFGIA